MIQEFINLVERKNLCFFNFQQLCYSFLNQISAGDFSQISHFQNQRHSLISALDSLETQISKTLDQIKLNPTEVNVLFSEKYRTILNKLFNHKESHIKSILALDNQILEHIKNQKLETIKKIQSIQNGKQQISKYKSPLDKIESLEKPTNIDQEA